jgi:hypothetical protein
VTAAEARVAAAPPTSTQAPRVVALDELDFSEKALEAVAPLAPPTRPAAASPELVAAPPSAASHEAIELPEVELAEDDAIELAPMHAFVPPPEAVGHRPEPPAPPPAAPADGGEAALREALSRASRDVIEKIAWEVVPQLAETIIREHLDRLVRERQGS